MTRRPWTNRDTALLHQLHAEGRSHADIAYILGCEYSALCKRARRYGLAPQGKPGWARGYRHTPEACAKIATTMRAKWEAEWNAKRHTATARMRAAKKPRPRIAPQRGTPESKLYRKLVEALGPQKGRAAWLEGRA